MGKKEGTQEDMVADLHYVAKFQGKNNLNTETAKGIIRTRMIPPDRHMVYKTIIENHNELGMFNLIGVRFVYSGELKYKPENGGTNIAV